jgi:hypothetical protein
MKVLMAVRILSQIKTVQLQTAPLSFSMSNCFVPSVTVTLLLTFVCIQSNLALLIHYVIHPPRSLP